MKKVLLLIDNLGQSGAERQMVYLAKELKNANCDIRLIKFYPGDSSYKVFLEKEEIKIEIIAKGQKTSLLLTEL